MKIFLTGGTGFIGSHFLLQALQEGYEVKALKRQPTSRTKIPLNKQPEWLEKDTEEVLVADMKGCDVLVHLAAHSVIYPFDTLENCIKYNVLSPLNLFNKAKVAGIKKFVVAGSCFEYGKSGERYDFIPTNAPLEPTQTYSTSKAMASLAFQQFAIDNKVQLSIHRIFQVYGEGENPNRLWPSLKKAALSGEDFPMTKGEQVRDFISVSDVVSHFLKACSEENTEKGSNVINVGTGKPKSILEFSQLWWHKWNAKGQLLVGSIPYRPGEIMRYVPEV